MKKPKTKHKLFDALREAFQLKNDTELARFLGVTPTPINDGRNGGYLSAGMILRVYDKTGWSIEEIRGYLESAE